MAHVDRVEQSGVYVNLGGVGFVDFGSGELVPHQVRREPLCLVAAFGAKVIATETAPAQGWDKETLKGALEKHRAVVLSLAPVDALVGDQWIGGTEV